MEESALVFRAPGLLLLSFLGLLALLAFTVVTSDLLDRVLDAFSRAAAAKYGSMLAANFRNLIAAGLWFFALAMVLRRARTWFGGEGGGRDAGRVERYAPLALLLVLLALFLVHPAAYALLPLSLPVGLLVLVAVVHTVRATRIPAIALRELTTLLVNPLGYVVLTVFTVVLAILFFGAVDRLGAAAPTSDLNIAPLKAFFGATGAASRELNFLMLALPLIVAVITMRLIAEERRSGTEEVLLTTPVREWHVVVGKFGGTFVFYLLMWAVALVPIYFLSLIGRLDGWQVLSSLFGLAVIGFGLLGVGMLASSITRNQLAAAVLTFLGMLAFTFQSFTPLPKVGGAYHWLRTAALYLDLRQHLAWVARGTIDSRTVFLFLSLGVFTLFLSVRAVETRRWAGFSLKKRMTAARGAVAGLGFLGLVVILIGVAVITGARQVRNLQEAHRQLVAARQRADAEARAAASTGVTQRPAGLFQEDKTPVEGGEKKIKPGIEAPAEEPDASGKAKAGEKKTKPASAAPKAGAPESEKKTSSAEKGGKEAGAAASAAKTEKPKTEKPKTEKPKTEKPRSEEPVFTASWTPRRILWMVGAGLILLMLYLAVFARWLSGGLHNQIVFGSNVIVSSLGALTLAVLVNYLATRNHKALDWTRGRIYSLAPPVEAAVDGALQEGESVDVIALVGRYADPDNRTKVDANIRRDALERVFQMFAEALNRPGVNRFNYEFVDPAPDARDRKAVERLKQVVGEFDATEYDVIIRFRDRHEILKNNALFEMVKHPGRFREFLEKWRNMIRRGALAPSIPPTEAEQFRVAELWLADMGSPNFLRTVQPRPDLEKILADAVVQLVESPGNNLYFTVGHGEKRLDIRRKAADLQRNFGEAWVFRQTLTRENFNLTPLAPLTGDRAIPERCRYLLIAGPTRPFQPVELDKIEKFVRDGGHLIVFTEASHKSGLAPLLEKFGVAVEKAQIWMARSGGPGRMGMGQLQPWWPYVVIDKFTDKHPITKALAAMSNAPEATQAAQMRSFPALLMLLASPLKVLEDAKVKKEWKVTTLLEAGMMGSPGRQMLMPYAETDIDQFRVTKDPKERLGPFPVAVICEAADEKLRAKRGKVIVVGDTDFIEDRLKFPDAWPPVRGEASTYGVYDNEQFVRKALDYLKKRPSQITAAITRPVPFAGDIRSPVIGVARWVLALFLPAAFLVCGLFVFIVRRRA